MKTYEVVNRLTRNGRKLKAGTKVRFHDLDAKALIAAGKIKPSKGKADDETGGVSPVAPTEEAPSK